jgi:hypothetical protein
MLKYIEISNIHSWKVLILVRNLTSKEIVGLLQTRVSVITSKLIIGFFFFFFFFFGMLQHALQSFDLFHLQEPKCHFTTILSLFQSWSQSIHP